MSKDHFPEVYKTEARRLHDDWPWPFSLIPRRWTGLCLVMPPRLLYGNAVERWMPIQPGYPLAPDAEFNAKRTLIKGVDPVHPSGQWSIQTFYSTRLKRRIPCYFSISKTFFGRRLHFNGPLKPDVTDGDWFWWVECSLTWTKQSRR